MYCLEVVSQRNAIFEKNLHNTAERDGFELLY